jgi:hypothetical protein
VDASGNVFVASNYSSSNNSVFEIVAAGGYTTVKTLLTGVMPGSIAVDGDGNVYFSDSNSAAIKEILAVGGYTTVKTLVSGLYCLEPSMALDPSGNLYFVDCSGQTAVVREALAADGYTTVNSLAAGFSAEFAGTRAIVDPGGNVIVADMNKALLQLDYADPPSLSYAGWTPVGVESSDSPLSFTVNNIGNTGLEFPAPGSGTNPTLPGGFVLDTLTTCPKLTVSSSAGVLAQGASCTYAVDFKPAAAGRNSGSLILTDNNLNMTSAPGNIQKVLLSGNGQGAAPSAVSVTPSSGNGTTQQFSFVGSFPNGASYAYMLLNTSLNGANGCWLQYTVIGNQLRLMSDDGPVWTSLGQLDHSQVSRRSAHEFAVRRGGGLSSSAGLGEEAVGLDQFMDSRGN